jgi:hypothetical protein
MSDDEKKGRKKVYNKVGKRVESNARVLMDRYKVPEMKKVR